MPVPSSGGIHMIENYIHYMLAFEFNHVGFISKKQNPDNNYD